MEFLQKTWNEIYSVVTSFRVVDIIDIALIAYLVYKGIQLVRETRAGQLVKGILALLVLALVANTLELTTLQFVIQTILSIGILAVIVIFQPELRRAGKSRTHAGCKNRDVWLWQGRHKQPGMDESHRCGLCSSSGVFKDKDRRLGCF